MALQPSAETAVTKASWPAFGDWRPQPSGEVVCQRAVYGKVHRAPTDYRWIAYSGGIAPGKMKLEREVALGSEDAPLTLYAWRYDALGAYAIKCYPSRAVDAAGRPAGLEKQVLYVPSTIDLPPAALAFLMLGEIAAAEDSIWWDAWRDPRWQGMDFFLPVPEARVSLENLEQSIEQGRAELREAATEGAVEQFFSATEKAPPAILSVEKPLPPLALAALLLPFERRATEKIGIAGGLPSRVLDRPKVAHWSGIACSENGTVNRTSRGARLAAILKTGPLRTGERDIR
jgi:hypothetical protein